MMKLLAGQLRGRSLKGDFGHRIRPTTGLVREALFDHLVSRISGARFLDLFSGSGAVGLEALSRGAKQVDFVDKDPILRKPLMENLRLFHLESRARLYSQSVSSFLRRQALLNGPYDIVFADPPYHRGIEKRLLSELVRGVMTSPSGLIVVEHFHKTRLPDIVDSFTKFQSRRYGDSVLSFYRSK